MESALQAYRVKEVRADITSHETFLINAVSHCCSFCVDLFSVEKLKVDSVWEVVGK